MSRPPKMTRARQEAILEGIRLGLPRMVAAAAAGIHHVTIRRWEERDLAFADEMKMAEAQAQQVYLGNINAVAKSREPGSWQANAWILERRWPEIYGQKSRLDVSIDTAEYLNERARKLGLTVEELMSRAEALGIEVAPSGTHSS